MKRRDPVAFFRFYVFILAFMLLVFGLVAMCLQTRPEVIRKEGKRITGTVLEKYWTSSGGSSGGKTYYVKVEASDNHVFKSGVASKSYPRFSEGEKVTVFIYKDSYYVDEHGSLKYLSPLYFLFPGLVVLGIAIFIKPIAGWVANFRQTWRRWRGVSSTRPEGIAADKPSANDAGIPEEPVFVRGVSTGMMQDKSLYFKPGRVDYRVSCGFVWFFVVMSILAAGVWFLPFREPTSTPLYLHQLIAIGIAWGGVCTLIPYFIIRKLGTEFVFDLRNEEILIYKKKKRIRSLKLKALRCLQLCCLIDTNFMAYQLNLCFESGERVVMVTSVSKASVRRTANKLAQALNRNLLDCTHAAYERENSDYEN